MKKYFLLFKFLLSVGIAGAQQKLFDCPLELKEGVKDRRDAFQIYDTDKKHLSLFILDPKAVHGFLLDSSFTLRSNLMAKRVEAKFKNLVGGYYANGKYYVVLTNDDKNEFAEMKFDFNNSSVSQGLMHLNFEKERFIEAFEALNKFYILTIKKNSSILKLYVISDSLNFDIREFDFSHFEFGLEYPKLFDVLFELVGYSKQVEIAEISAENPNSPELSAYQNKLYVQDNKMLLSLDNFINVTNIVSIDLNTYNSSVKSFKKGAINCNGYSNSFIYRHILYHIISCKQELYFSAFDMSTDAYLKEYRVKADEEISFKNTPLLKDRGTYVNPDKSDKVLAETDQFLKKLSGGVPTVSVCKLQDDLEIMIGSYRLQSSGGGGAFMMGGAMGGAAGAAMAPPVMYSPVFSGYNSYKYTKSVYFKCLFDMNMNHLPGQVSENSFDKILKFSLQNEYRIGAEMIFKEGNDYIFGFYHEGPFRYYLYRFNN